MMHPALSPIKSSKEDASKGNLFEITGSSNKKQSSGNSSAAAKKQATNEKIKSETDNTQSQIEKQNKLILMPKVLYLAE